MSKPTTLGRAGAGCLVLAFVAFVASPAAAASNLDVLRQGLAEPGDSTINCNQTQNPTLSAASWDPPDAALGSPLPPGTRANRHVVEAAAGALSVSVTNSDFPPTIVVVTGDATEEDQLTEVGSSSVGLIGSSNSVDVTLPSAGTYTVAVANATETFGDYTIRVTCTANSGGGGGGVGGGEGTPAAPTRASANVTGADTATAFWTDASGNEDGFEVFAKMEGETDFSSMGTVGAGETSANLTGLTPGATYDLEIRSFNGAGASVPSNPVSITMFPDESGPCVENSSTLCMNGDRFRTQVSWSVAGNSGLGMVTPFSSDDSGLFFFFNPDNWEMLVKVLDGCAVNDRFWVFFAATTDVAFSLRVEDTQSGTTNLYTNPLGQPANAITDTDAFATCE